MNYQEKVERGASIVIKDWMKLKSNEKLCIVTSNKHYSEAEELKKFAEEITNHVAIMLVKDEGKYVGVFFDENEKIFDVYDAIIGATDYSIVTTKSADRAIKKGKKFLSLPLSTNNGMSMLAFDFLTVDTELSRIKAQILLKYIEKSSKITVSTALGTHLEFSMKRRKPGFFNGTVKDGKGYASASVEVYIPIVETKTNGTLILDGSFGYIGKVEKPVRVEFKDGRIVSIEDNESGHILDQHLKDYQDENMYVAAEFGIGLNPISKCNGDCYIEDESVYGTFHIGFGRNHALGGKHEAKSHFDLVTCKPNIYFDNRLIMEEGEITIPEFRI
ncbi:aminopeptidase [Anaerorhabdus sp.]|uniref:aminopeptidase n=1 Tax=Anaerorhabdus sp. TaxID=1872524 RepID=UPI002FCAFDE6